MVKDSLVTSGDKVDDAVDNDIILSRLRVKLTLADNLCPIVRLDLKRLKTTDDMFVIDEKTRPIGVISRGIVTFVALVSPVVVVVVLKLS